MTITTPGRQFICANFGDASFCCVDAGLSWYYTAGGTNYPETGGTAQVVSRLVVGIVDSVTMTSPATGTFTQTQLNTANGQAVTLADCQTITQHDNPADPGGQWCYLPCSTWTDAATCEYYGCYWYNGACHSNAPACSELNNQTDCLAYSCYWYNGSCHSNAPACSELNNQTDCTLYGCYWYNNSCHSTWTCESITNATDCSTYGCYWYNNSCHSAIDCNAINNQTECLGYGCYWYLNACHSTDWPELCYWIEEHGGATDIDITEVFMIVDAYIYSSPPSGYSFIPTVENVMGIIDYYLGFVSSGNTKTGCSF